MLKQGQNQNKFDDLDHLLPRLHQNGEAKSLNLVVDVSKREVAVMIKLHSLQKRVLFIKHVLGGWKPTARYSTLTHQIEQVQRFLELMDSQKIAYYMKRVEVLLGELDELQGQHAEMTAEERVKELGHPKELHEKLWQACQSVKATYEDLPKLVERME